MPCRLPLVRPDFDATERPFAFKELLVHIVMVLAIVYVSFVLFPSPALYVILLIAGILTIGRSLRRTRRDWVRQRDIIGTLVLDDDQVATEGLGADARIGALSGWTIRMATHYIQGRGARYKDILHNGIATLTLKHGDAVHTFKFLVRDKAALEALIAVLKTWYRNRYDLHESAADMAGAVFLTRWDWHYADLQAAKRELGIHKP